MRSSPFFFLEHSEDYRPVRKLNDLTQVLECMLVLSNALQEKFVVKNVTLQNVPEREYDKIDPGKWITKKKY